MASTKEDYDLVEDTVSDTSPHVLLHPLVLVSEDDHATRSNMRDQGVIIGAILGQHHGKQISMEVSFECGSGKLFVDGPEVALNGQWFSDMLKLCK
jgi:COP9 signalosome complex subunit 6